MFKRGAQTGLLDYVRFALTDLFSVIASAHLI